MTDDLFERVEKIERIQDALVNDMIKCELKLRVISDSLAKMIKDVYKQMDSIEKVMENGES